jgi:hydrogenase expression/formation protein HypD
MKYIDEFRSRALVQDLARRLAALAPEPATVMEVCGTHTMAAARFGLKSLLPPGVQLISGPGCPVCVTAASDLDAFLALGSRPDTVLTSFGDMLRVPGSHSSLENQRAQGADVRVVYSPLDAVELARQTPEKAVVFFGVGFETTMPATAMAIRLAANYSLNNFSVLCAHKTIPAALRALLASGEVLLSGLLLPGHVTTIIGAAAYDFIPGEFGLPCAVTGFEPVDMMLGLESILGQIKSGQALVANVYTRAVQLQPNPRARELLDEVFAASDAHWRGLGVIPGSGATIREKYARWDARVRFPEVWEHLAPPPASACRCGEVLRGVLRPHQCPLFGQACSPAKPLGPCMVSSEGACAAAYRYERAG